MAPMSLLFKSWVIFVGLKIKLYFSKFLLPKAFKKKSFILSKQDCFVLQGGVFGARKAIYLHACKYRTRSQIQFQLKIWISPGFVFIIRFNSVNFKTSVKKPLTCLTRFSSLTILCIQHLANANEEALPYRTRTWQWEHYRIHRSSFLWGCSFAFCAHFPHHPFLNQCLHSHPAKQRHTASRLLNGKCTAVNR